MKRHIPNMVTLINLLSGCITVYLLFSNQYDSIWIFILISIVADVSDGLLARALRVQSNVGKELDSLADLVSFGLVPAVMLIQLMHSDMKEVYYVFPFVLTLFSALRLAKFNASDDQETEFKGLATPAAALFVYGIFFQLQYDPSQWYLEYINIFVYVVVVVLSVLLTMPLPMFSFKVKDWSWRSAYWQYVYIFFTIILLLRCTFAGISFSILLYIALNGIRYIQKRMTT